MQTLAHTALYVRSRQTAARNLDLSERVHHRLQHLGGRWATSDPDPAAVGDVLTKFLQGSLRGATASRHMPLGVCADMALGAAASQR
jgi:hypothetical protein